MMRIFITGSSGQLGCELSQALGNEELFLGTRSVCDITSEKTISMIRDFKPDVVIHAAAYTDVDGCELNSEQAHHVNAVGTYHVARGAEESRAKLVYISTDYVFNGEKEGPYTVTDNPAPINVYGRSKWEGEQFVQQSCHRHVILRTAWVYGHTGRNFVRSILDHASPDRSSGEKNEPIPVVNDQVGSPTYARDLAHVIADIIKLDAYGIYHAAGGGACSRYELAVEAIRHSGLKCDLVPIASSELDSPVKRPRNSSLSQEKLNSLGITLRPWQEALKKCIRNLV